MIARIISGLLVLFFGGLFLLPTVCAQTVKVGITSKTLFLYALLRRPKERLLCGREHQD